MTNWRKDRLNITDDKVYKLYKGKKLFNKEKYIYELKLHYTPKLIDFDENKKELIIEKFGENLVSLPLNQRKKYYPKCKELYYKFQEDTGFYLYDFRPQNIVIKGDELKLIDFEYYGVNQDIWKSNINFYKKIGVIYKDKVNEL